MSGYQGEKNLEWQRVSEVTELSLLSPLPPSLLWQLFEISIQPDD